VEVVCAGPKNYYYKSYNSTTGESKTVCKVRCKTLKYNASQLVNCDKDKRHDLEQERRRDSYREYRAQDETQKTDGGVNLVSEPEDKTYRLSLLKAKTSQ
jgi:hypothetical protein